MRRRKHGQEKAAAKVWQENEEQQVFHAGQNSRCALAAASGGHGIQTRVRLASRYLDICKRPGREMSRVASAPFGSFDPFCSVRHFFAFLANGVGDWQPQYRY
jgi:hypothetical protein